MLHEMINYTGVISVCFKIAGNFGWCKLLVITSNLPVIYW